MAVQHLVRCDIKGCKAECEAISWMPGIFGSSYEHPKGWSTIRVRHEEKTDKEKQYSYNPMKVETYTLCPSHTLVALNDR